MKLVKFLFLLISIVFTSIYLISPNLQAEDKIIPFEPAWWCQGGHLQTIYGGLFHAKPDLLLKRERLELPDGDFIDLDWLDGNEDKPLVVILHGLGSSAHVPYVLSMVEEIQKIGWRAVAINARGSLEPNRLLETTHAGKSEDLDFVLNHLIKMRHSAPSELSAAQPSMQSASRGAPIYLIGYSLGGNVILKYLGEKGEAVPEEVVKAAAVSVPYDLEQAAHNLDQGFNREVYTRIMLNHLKAQTFEKAKRFPNDINFEKVRNMNTFQAYDREITARLNGFRDERDYWAQSSSVNYLENIKIQVLLIHAIDDPFLPKRDLPLEKIEKLPHLKLVLTQDGGHLGFISGAIPFHPDKWLESTLLGFFEHE